MACTAAVCPACNWGSCVVDTSQVPIKALCLCKNGSLDDNYCPHWCEGKICNDSNYENCLGTVDGPMVCSNLQCPSCGYGSCILNDTTTVCKCSAYNRIEPTYCEYPNCGSQYCLPNEETCYNNICVKTVDYNNICGNCRHGYCMTTTETPSNLTCSCYYPQNGTSDCLLPCGYEMCLPSQLCVPTANNTNNHCVNHTEMSMCEGICSSCFATDTIPAAVSCNCDYGGTYPNCNGPPCDGTVCDVHDKCLPVLPSSQNGTNHTHVCTSLTYSSQCSCSSSSFSYCAADTSSSPPTPVCTCQGYGTYSNCYAFCSGVACSSSYDFCIPTTSGYSQCTDQYCNLNCGDGVCALNDTSLETTCLCRNGKFQSYCEYSNCGNEYCTASEACLYTAEGNGRCVSGQQYQDVCTDCIGNCEATNLTPSTPRCKCGGDYCSYDESCLYTLSYEFRCVKRSEKESVCSHCGFGNCVATQSIPANATCHCLWEQNRTTDCRMPCGKYKECVYGETCIPTNNSEYCVNQTEYNYCQGFCSNCFAVGPDSRGVSCDCDYGGTYPNCNGPPCEGGVCNLFEKCLPVLASTQNGTNQTHVCTPLSYGSQCNCGNFAYCAADASSSPPNPVCTCIGLGTYSNCYSVCNGTSCTDPSDYCLPTISGSSQCTQKYCSNCGYGDCALNDTSNETTCKCYNGGFRPYCEYPNCGSETCTSTQSCIYTIDYKSKCVDTEDYQRACFDCGYGRCVATNTTPTNATCYCWNTQTTATYCGQACGNSECTTKQTCLQTLEGESKCVASSDAARCSNCGYGSCIATNTTPANVTCKCYYYQKLASTCGQPCGSTECFHNEQCVGTVTAPNNQVCVANCMCTGYSSCLANTTTTPPTPTCGCYYSGTYPFCSGPPCGRTFCKSGESCYPNAVPGAEDICVSGNNVDCSNCDSAYTCKGVLGTPSNFAECKCTRPSPSDPNTCLPTQCEGMQCWGYNNHCNATGQCVCNEGFSRNFLSSYCSLNPLFATCTPCINGRNTNCGCPFGQTCSVTSSTLGRCVCDADFLTGVAASCQPNIPLPKTSFASCLVTGGADVKTFDRYIYDVNYNCDYVLVQSSSLNVHVRLGECLNQLGYCVNGIALSFGVDKLEVSSNVVYVNNNLISTLPYQTGSQSISIDVSNGTYTVTLSDGTILTYNDDAAWIEVGTAYYNKVRGLCGTFDSTQVDDFTNRSGVVLNDVSAFTDNWKVGSGDSQLFNTPMNCTRTSHSDPFNKCEIRSVSELAAKFNGTYHITGNSSQCYGILDLYKIQIIYINEICDSKSVDKTNIWIRECENDYARLSQKCGPCLSGFVCATFPNRTVGCVPDQCHCGAHEDCFSVFTATGKTDTCVCSSGYRRDSSGACIDANLCGGVYCNRTNEFCSRQLSDGTTIEGCICVQGYVRNLETQNCEPIGKGDGLLAGCLICNENNMGNCGCSVPHSVCISRGASTNLGRCNCELGYKQNQTTGLCDEVKVIPTPTPTPGICQAFGDVHYKTFDSAYVDDQVPCDAVLFQAENITIHVRQTKCRPTSFVACARGLAVHTDDGHIVEIDDQDDNFVMAVDHSVTTGSQNIGNTKIKVNGHAVTISIGTSIVLKYTRSFSVTLNVLGSWRMKNISGICGNFNDNPNDDVFQEGTFNINHSPLFSQPNHFCSQKRSTQQTQPNDPNCEIKATTDCGILLNLDQYYPTCTLFVNLLSYYEACIYDYCALGSTIVDASVKAATSFCSYNSNIYTAYISNITLCNGSPDCDTSTIPPSPSPSDISVPSSDASSPSVSPSSESPSGSPGVSPSGSPGVSPSTPPTTPPTVLSSAPLLSVSLVYLLAIILMQMGA